MYREEALNGQADRLYGPILLVRPLSSWVYVASAAMVVLCIMAYVVFASYTKRTTATGVLLPIHGMVRLMAPLDDVVSQCRVEEGQHVRRGDVPCVLADGRAQLSGAAVRTLSQVHPPPLSNDALGKV